MAAITFFKASINFLPKALTEFVLVINTLANVNEDVTEKPHAYQPRPAASRYVPFTGLQCRDIGYRGVRQKQPPQKRPDIGFEAGRQIG